MKTIDILNRNENNGYPLQKEWVNFKREENYI